MHNRVTVWCLRRLIDRQGDDEVDQSWYIIPGLSELVAASLCTTPFCQRAICCDVVGDILAKRKRDVTDKAMARGTRRLKRRRPGIGTVGGGMGPVGNRKGFRCYNYFWGEVWEGAEGVRTRDFGDNFGHDGF